MPEVTEPIKPTTYTHLLRVEGVNHGSFIFDTTDLSTIRGGGLLLLDAANQVLQHAKKYDSRATAISTGASSALIALNIVGNDAEANVSQVVTDIGRAFRADPHFKHATFVASALKASLPASFAFDREAILAKNRHAQMTALSLTVPSLQSAEVCAVDRIRPADPATKDLKPGPLSDSVHRRREYGRSQKQRFYADEIADANPVLSAQIKSENWQFTQDFDDIGKVAPKRVLDNKLAIFYADGNSFGKHQRAVSAAKLNEWDRAIKTYRRKLLAEILKDHADGGPYAHDNPKRFETLLWGGDEMIFVMPAWRGIEFVEKFFERTADWQFEGALTHAVGLVFCHDNAPIHAVRKLAQDLAESAKNTTDRKGNSINYAVLESFDHVGNAWPDYLRRVYNGKLCEKNRCLKADEFQKVTNALRALTETLPRTRLAPYLQALIADDASDSNIKSATKCRDEDLEANTKTHTATLTELKKDCPIACWSHAADLWDYVNNTERARA